MHFQLNFLNYRHFGNNNSLGEYNNFPLKIFKHRKWIECAIKHKLNVKSIQLKIYWVRISSALRIIFSNMIDCTCCFYVDWLFHLNENYFAIEFIKEQIKDTYERSYSIVYSTKILVYHNYRRQNNETVIGSVIVTHAPETKAK